MPSSYREGLLQNGQMWASVPTKIYQLCNRNYTNGDSPLWYSIKTALSRRHFEHCRGWRPRHPKFVFKNHHHIYYIQIKKETLRQIRNISFIIIFLVFRRLFRSHQSIPLRQRFKSCPVIHCQTVAFCKCFFVQWNLYRRKGKTIFC